MRPRCSRAVSDLVRPCARLRQNAHRHAGRPPPAARPGSLSCSPQPGATTAEANLYTALLGMQMFAEFTYHGSFEDEWLAQRMRVCCPADARAFWDLTLFNHMEGMRSGEFPPGERRENAAVSGPAGPVVYQRHPGALRCPAITPLWLRVMKPIRPRAARSPRCGSFMRCWQTFLQKMRLA